LVSLSGHFGSRVANRLPGLLYRKTHVWNKPETKYHARLHAGSGTRYDARSLSKRCVGKECIVAPRPYWKGYLRLSLVSCPIALYPATSEREKISFHQLN